MEVRGNSRSRPGAEEKSPCAENRMQGFERSVSLASRRSILKGDDIERANERGGEKQIFRREKRWKYKVAANNAA
jgi:hypothetical protein